MSCKKSKTHVNQKFNGETKVDFTIWEICSKTFTVLNMFYTATAYSETRFISSRFFQHVEEVIEPECLNRHRPSTYIPGDNEVDRESLRPPESKSDLIYTETGGASK